MNDLISQEYFPKEVFHISEHPNPQSEQCTITITMDWKIAHALRNMLAPFLHQFCKGIDVRSCQEKSDHLKKERRATQKKEVLKNSALQKIRRYKAVYRDGITYAQWRTMDIGLSREHYYKVRRRAILWHKNRGLKNKQLANFFGMSYAAIDKVVKSTHAGNSKILPARVLEKLSLKNRMRYYRNEPILLD